MRNSRILISREVLDSIQKDVNQGVPFTRAIKNAQLTTCRPVISKLYDLYTLFPGREDSLFPPWLTEREQTQPSNWDYVGKWPIGKWVENE